VHHQGFRAVDRHDGTGAFAALAVLVLAAGCRSTSEANFQGRGFSGVEMDSLAVGELSQADNDAPTRFTRDGIDLTEQADPQVRKFAPSLQQVQFRKPNVQMANAGAAVDPAAVDFPNADPLAPSAAEPAATKAPRAPRLQIYSSRFQILVPAVSEALEKLLAEVEAAGGYLEKRENESIVCRVPAERFKEVLARIRTAGRVLDESTEALDVTSQYRDVELRIDVARKSRLRLLALLEKADKTEDALKIETVWRSLASK
jgi:hypothetical protein